jgi:energy-coupling factor transport system permease protein
MSWALENSIDTSMSMKARGYGIKGRSHYSRYSFRVTDAITIIIILVLDFCVLKDIGAGYSDIEFYPVIRYAASLQEAICMYICFGVLVCILSIVEIKENIKWKYYVSRI